MRVTEDQIICGLSAIQLKDKFRELMRFGFGNIFKTGLFEKDIESKLVAEGYLEYKGDGICCTIKGNSLGMASTEDPISREEAEELMKLLKITIINYNKSLVNHIIGSVFVFGSYLSDKKELNDIDLAFEIVPKGFYKELVSNQDALLLPEDMQENHFNSVVKFFKKVSPRYSIHHYRELGKFKQDNGDTFKYKMVYQNDSDDAKAYDAAKYLRVTKMGHNRIQL